MHGFCKKWRKRVGVEPTQAGEFPTRSGFEDRDCHRTTCASASVLTGQCSLASGPRGHCIEKLGVGSRNEGCRSFLQGDWPLVLNGPGSAFHAAGGLSPSSSCT